MGTGFVGGAIGNTGVGYLVKKYKKTWFVGAFSVPATVLARAPCVGLSVTFPPSLEARTGRRRAKDEKNGQPKSVACEGKDCSMRSLRGMLHSMPTVR